MFNQNYWENLIDKLFFQSKKLKDSPELE